MKRYEMIYCGASGSHLLTTYSKKSSILNFSVGEIEVSSEVLIPFVNLLGYEIFNLTDTGISVRVIFCSNGTL